eukprot:s122_g31.t1
MSCHDLKIEQQLDGPKGHCKCRGASRPRPQSVELVISLGSLGLLQLEWPFAMYGAPTGPRLWAECHHPRNESSLVVAKKKIAEVRDFLFEPNGKARQVDEALDLFRRLESGRVPGVYGTLRPDVVTCNTALSCCERGSRWRDAVQLLQSSEANVRGFNSCISCCGKAAEWRQAIATLETLETADVISFNGAISALALAHAPHDLPTWPMALDVMARLPTRRLEASVVSFSSLMIAAQRRWRLVLQLRRDDRGSWDRVAYNAGLSEKAGRWQTASFLLASAGFQPDVISYSSTISACEKSGHWQMAIHLWCTMLVLRLLPNVITCNGLLGACEKAGQWLVALALLHHCLTPWENQLHGIRPNVISFSCVISACARCGEWLQALELLLGQLGGETGVTISMTWCPSSLAKMTRVHQVSPNVVSFSGAITACERAFGLWKVGVALLDLMSCHAVEQDVVSWSSAVSACEEGGLWRTVAQLLRNAKVLSSSSYGVNAACSACGKAFRWQRALQLTEGDLVSYNSAISATQRGHQWRKTLELLKIIGEEELHPDALSFCSALNAAERAAAGHATVLLAEALADWATAWAMQRRGERRNP